jgi:hypothetical protein
MCAWTAKVAEDHGTRLEVASHGLGIGEDARVNVPVLQSEKAHSDSGLFVCDRCRAIYLGGLAVGLLELKVSVRD